MTTGATGQLGLALPVQGELSGTWGDTVNNGITQYTNIAIAGTLTLTGDGAVTLANTTGDASASNITSTLAGAGTVTAQFAIVKVSGTTTTKVVTGPSYSKTYVVDNASSFAVTFKASGQTGVSVAAAEKVTVVFNGTDYIKLAGTIANAAGSNTQIQFNNGGLFGASANLTWDGTTLSSTQINITGQGTLRLQDTTGGEYVGLRSPSALGASYTLTFPADDGTSGQALITDGSGGLSWSTAASGDVYGPGSSTDNAVARFDSTTGKLLQNSVVIIGDTGDVSGVGTLSATTLTLTNALGTAYGGTGLTSFTSGGVVYASSTSALATGSALTFDGTNFGIGNPTPTFALDIATATARVRLAPSVTTNAALFQATNGGGSVYFGLDNSAGTTFTTAYALNIYHGGNYPIIFSTNAAERLRLTSTLLYTASATNIAIGTSSATAATRLTIQESATNASALSLINRNSTQTWKINVDASAVDDKILAFVDNATSTVRLALTDTGNLGLGVTPSAWFSAYKAIQVGAKGSVAYSSSATFLGNNWYQNTSGTNTYLTTGTAGIAGWDGNSYVWYQAPSGTAGNAISFTQAMTLDASGNLGVGTTSPTNTLHLKSETDANIKFEDTTSGTAGYVGPSANNQSDTTAQRLGIRGETGVAFSVGSSTKMVLDNSGNFGVGTTTPALKAQINGLIGGPATSGTTQTGIMRLSQGSGSLILDFGIRTSPDVAWIQSTDSGNLATNYPLCINPNGGRLLVGSTTSVVSADEIAGFVGNSGISAKAINSSANFAGAFWNNATAGDNNFLTFLTEIGGTQRGGVTYNRAAGLTSFNTTSDYRAKDINGPVTGSGALIDSVPVYMGKMKDATQERPMFLAHETPAYAHTGVKDAVDADGNPVYQQMDASALIPVMWAEIQSLRQRLSAANL